MAIFRSKTLKDVKPVTKSPSDKFQEDLDYYKFNVQSLEDSLDFAKVNHEYSNDIFCQLAMARTNLELHLKRKR